MQNWLYLYEAIIASSLAIFFAARPDVIVACEVSIAHGLPRRLDVRIPDLSVIIGGDRELMIRQKGYAIDRQGKALDFALGAMRRTDGRRKGAGRLEAGLRRLGGR